VQTQPHTHTHTSIQTARHDTRNTHDTHDTHEEGADLW
jgi:hypothetical protein